MADITAHALPSGHGEKMKIGHPTNPKWAWREEKMKTIVGIIRRGMGGPSLIRWYDLEGHEVTKSSQGAIPQQPIHNSKDLEKRRGIVHMCLSG